MMYDYFMLLGFAIFAIGIAGVVATRHLLILILSVEIAISASIIIAAGEFHYIALNDIVGFLFVVWAVASAEIIALIAIYRYMYKSGISMDITKLSKLRDEG